jgi:hypothetical protein
MRGSERMADYEWSEMDNSEEEYERAEQMKFEEPGDTYMGIYKEYIDTTNDKGEPVQFWKFESLIDGEPDLILFPTAVLRTKMENVEPNTPLKIEYIGYRQSQKSSHQYKDFKFFTGE